jgi:hypothetical protein
MNHSNAGATTTVISLSFLMVIAASEWMLRKIAISPGKYLVRGGYQLRFAQQTLEDKLIFNVNTARGSG